MFRNKTGADAIEKVTSSLGIPYLGVQTIFLGNRSLDYQKKL